LGNWGLDGDIHDLERPFTAVATNLETGREVWFNAGPVLPAVRASVSIPGLFTPYCIDGRWLVDGGLVNPVPISVARAMGADVVIAVNPLAKPSGRYWTPHLRDSDRGVRHEIYDRMLEWLPKGLRDGLQPAAAPDPVSPRGFEVINASIDILSEYLARTRMAADPADVMIDVDLTDLSVLAFYEVETAIAAGRQAAEAMRGQIEAALHRG
jgi:NTE family protein